MFRYIVDVDVDDPEYEIYSHVRDFLYLKYNETIESYAANVHGTTINFFSPDFIQGINTAADWLGLDPHTIITNLVQFQRTFDGEGEENETIEIPLNF